MNIAFLFELPISPNAGGIERVSFLLAEEFTKMNHSVKFISTSSDQQSGNPVQNKFQQLYVDSTAKDTGASIKDIMNECKIDVVINQSMLLSTLKFLPYIKASRAKLITVLHNRPFALIGYESFCVAHSYPTNLTGKLINFVGKMSPQLFGLYRKRQMRYLYDTVATHSDYFMLLSDRYISRLLTYAPKINIDKVKAINNPNTFNITDLNPNKKENLIIFVGRLSDPQKNVMGFIDVWNYFYAKNPHWKAIVIGDGPQRDIFEKYAHTQNTKHLTFVGNQKDIASFYSNAKVLCMTSLYEGWPMVLAEAMAYGCIPVVYDTFEACHDLISNCVNGRIVEPFAAQKMADVISQVVNDPQLLQRMSLEAKSSISQYSPHNIAGQWINLINTLNIK